jgi:hypothetical protein
LLSKATAIPRLLLSATPSWTPSVEVPQAVPFQTFIHASLPLLSTPSTIRLLFGSPATTVHWA